MEPVDEERSDLTKEIAVESSFGIQFPGIVRDDLCVVVDVADNDSTALRNEEVRLRGRKKNFQKNWFFSCYGIRFDLI